VIVNFTSKVTTSNLYQKPIGRTSRSYIPTNVLGFPEKFFVTASRRDLDKTLRLLVFEERYCVADKGVFSIGRSECGRDPLIVLGGSNAALFEAKHPKGLVHILVSGMALEPLKAPKMLYPSSYCTYRDI